MSTAQAQAKVRRLTRRVKVSSLAFAPQRIFVDKLVSDHPQTIRILNKLPEAEVDVVDSVSCLKKSTDYSDAKQQLILTAHKGQAFKPCQGIGEGHICCNYRVMDLISGCPMDCSYCILQSYLANNPRTAISVNIEEILSEVANFLSSHSGKFFRIGTGELSDSLALDPITEYSSLLIPFFASKQNAILELKTKTAFVDHLLALKHRGRTVISWSVNTPAVISSEEKGTATLDERIAAAAKVAAAGYGVGFHFDPIIIFKNVEDEIGAYVEVIDRIFQGVEARKISWISLGLLRYPRELSDIAVRRFPETRIFSGEMVPSGGKMRYLRFIREKALGVLWNHLKSKLPINKIYICMETKAVWEKIDPSISSNSCLEKRLCNTESVAFDYLC